MPATLHDVARLAGVSIKTVSNVVNDYPHVRAETRERVLVAIRELDYTPNLSARSLRSGRSGVIGLAVPELALPYFAELAAEVIEAATKRELVVHIEQTNRNRAREVEVLTSPRLQMLDGILFSPLELGNEDAALVDIDLPMVLLGERIFTATTDHITMRNVEAARAATEYLIGLGHRRIAAIGVHPGEVTGSAGLRLAGYCEALEAAGIPFDPSLLGVAFPWHRRHGAESMRGLLDTGVAFDAVFAFNDTLALGAMHAMQERGMRIPEDVSVMGFDDLDEGQYSLPTLTSIDAGRRQIAELAVDTLVGRIADRAKPVTQTEVDFSVVERDSTMRRP